MQTNLQTQTQTIHIGKQEMAFGIPRNCALCPIALRIQKLYPAYRANVNSVFAYLLDPKTGKTAAYAWLPQPARAFVLRFDEGGGPLGAVQPINFDLQFTFNPNARAAMIRDLNDAFRTSDGAGRNRKVMTAGIAALPMQDRLAIFAKIRNFNDFGPGNDPYGEHDFGRITHNEMSIVFKIDYYDNDLEHHSADPTDPDQCIRVMTIMAASDY